MRKRDDGAGHTLSIACNGDIGLSWTLGEVAISGNYRTVESPVEPT